jgi:hypothetical protein
LLLKFLLLSITIAFLHPEAPLTLVFERQDSLVNMLTGLHAERPVFSSRYEHIFLTSALAGSPSTKPPIQWPPLGTLS